MNERDRIIEFIKYKGMTMTKFQETIGVCGSYIRNVGHLNQKAQDNVRKHFPELNMNWILTGEGEMINPVAIESDNCCEQEGYIPILPISAQGGNLNDFVTNVMDYNCEKMISPINGADFAIAVSGESMSPEFPNGSKVIIKKINDKAFIDWGRAYVLDTCNGVIIKNVFPGSDSGHIKCVSVNKEFPSYEICVDDIIGIYRILMSIAIK